MKKKEWTLEDGLYMRKGWTFGDAVKFLKSIMPLLKKAGYEAQLVGSVINKGYSEKDLDILLTPTREDFNFELIMEKLPGDFTMDMETYEHWTEDGRLVDFHFEKEEK